MASTRYRAVRVARAAPSTIWTGKRGSTRVIAIHSTTTAMPANNQNKEKSQPPA